MFHWVEIIGYVASVLIAVSLTMSSLAKLRFLNLLGAIVFAAYGYLVGAFPVMVVNGFIAMINIVYLLKMQPGRSEAFELLALNHPDNLYLQRFLDFHREEIQKFFPDFKADLLLESQIVFILRNMLPVGLVVCRRTDDQTLTVLLDYVIPSDRDFQCARYFYRSWPDVISCQDVCRFVVHSGVATHRRYLKKVGFVPDLELGPDVYVRTA